MAPLISQGLTSHLVFAIAVAAIGSGFQHGYNLGVVNAPQNHVEDFINGTIFSRQDYHPNKHFVSLVFSAIVSIYPLGGMIGGLVTIYIARWFGSRGGLLLNNVLVFIGAIFLGFSKLAASYEMLITGRFIVGVNAGINAGLAPMYLTEISPIDLRGASGTLYQLSINISILISQILSLPQILSTKEGWPILFALIVIPAVLMLVTLSLCPESPRHLYINKGKNEEAKKALVWLRETDEVEYEITNMEREYEHMKSIPKVSLKEMCVKPYFRKPFIICTVMMLSQQLCGVTVFIYYSSAIFRESGLNEIGVALATLGIGIIKVLMTLISVVLVEKAGRKSLLLIGHGGMGIVAALLTTCIALTPYAQWLSYLSIVCVYTFIMFFSIGPGPIPWFLVSELFEQGPRPIATSIAVAASWFSNFLVGLCFLPLMVIMGEYTYLIFAFLLLIFWLFTYYYVPETKGRTIEEITAEFRKWSSK